ncbi:MAG: flavodoxin family protein [Clostridia bacterium]|nr:flavodoxin family protein [Clostridia bacterium]
MKVVLLNGSPHVNGTTARALKEVADELIKNGIDSEIIHVGAKPVRDCIGCARCVELNKCVFEDDLVNELVQKVKQSDGLIVGTPVYYASATGVVRSVLDRMFYSSQGAFAFKPAATVAVARRAGTVTAFDEINRYFTISRMPIVSSTYWNNVHGKSAKEAEQDKEGMQTMRNLARNMAWMIKCIKAGEKEGVSLPETERISQTNFIR